jgi:hypothetical protein
MDPRLDDDLSSHLNYWSHLYRFPYCHYILTQNVSLYSTHTVFLLPLLKMPILPWILINSQVLMIPLSLPYIWFLKINKTPWHHMHKSTYCYCWIYRPVNWIKNISKKVSIYDLINAFWIYSCYLQSWFANSMPLDVHHPGLILFVHFTFYLLELCAN